MLKIVAFVAAGLALGGCMTTHSTRLPESGRRIEVAYVNGNLIAPSVTVVCVEGADNCQSHTGQALLPAVLQGAVGSTISGGAIIQATKLTKPTQISPVQIQETAVRTGGVKVTTGGATAISTTRITQ